MSKPIIAIDIDDVLSSQSDVLIKFSNENYGTNLSREDLKTPGEYWGYYDSLWKVNPEEGKKRFETFLEAKMPLTQVVEPATIKALEKLKQRFRLEVVTSRGAEYQQGTIDWLERYLPNIFDNVQFTEIWNGDKKASKAIICQEIGAKFLIDDNAEHCNLAAEAGIQALLFGEFGWNIHQELNANVARVNDWDAVLEYFDAWGR